jgi:HD-GYP domain-containing protein (c-di-GMP phosphodiesterase class II)
MKGGCLKKKVYVGDLQLGMYVEELDRPWLGTPFLLKGLHLNTADDIKAVRDLCEYVFIDVEKGVDVCPDKPRVQQQAREKGEDKKPKNAKAVTLERVVDYNAESLVPFRHELIQAAEFHRTARHLMDSIHADIRAGRLIDTASAEKVVSNMVDSIIRNPNALLWLSELKNVDEYTAIHSLNVCILSLAFGRHLGLSPDTLRELGLGALLHDMGKIKVDQEVLRKPGRLSTAEFELMKLHPQYGLDILKQAKELPSSVLDVAYSHHERAMGQGYPRGIKGMEINPLTRMVSIVDFYDALTSDRVYRKGISSAEVNRSLYEGHGKEFDPDLVREFIGCLGIFPVGSIVELTSGEIAIVTSVNPARRLKPTVLLVLDKDKKPYSVLRMANLWQLDENGVSREILHMLKPGSYGVQTADYVKELLASA